METWLVATIDVLLLVLTLYGVGYCALRICNVRRLWSLTCAPLISVTFLFLLTTAFAGVIPANSWTLTVVPFLVLAGVCLALGRIQLYDKRKKSAQKLLLLSIVCSAVLFGFIYIRMAGSADNYAWLVDNSHHMSTALSLTQKTNWSLFDPWSHTYYAAGSDPLGENLGQGGFYPPVWQWLVALPATVIPQNIAVAQNALIAFICIVVIPVSVFGLVSIVFNERSDVRAASAVASLSFISFPWVLLVWGPLYPNLLSYTLVLPSVSTFFLIFRPRLNRRVRIIFSLIFFCGLLSLLLAQPNGVIVLGVFLAPFLVWLISRIPKFFCSNLIVRTLLRFLFGALAVCAIALVWYVLITSSFVANAADFHWPNFITEDVVFQNILTAHFAVGFTLAAGPQYVAASCVLVGFVAALVKRETRWLAITYLLFCLLYGVCVSSDDPNKWMMTGFWYNDSFRLSSALALAGIPLFALGLATFAQGIVSCFQKMLPCYKKAAFVLILGVFALANYWVSPNFSPTHHSGAYPLVSADVPDNDWPMGYPFQRIEFAVARDINPLYMHRVAEKRDFMKKAASITGQAWVMNYPLDGSLFGYPCEGLKTLVRSPASIVDENRLLSNIALHLDSISTDEDLAKQLYELGVAYVIRLENEGAPRAAFLQNPDYQSWAGFYHVHAKTPGFEKVLAEDGMELYRICWEDIKTE